MKPYFISGQCPPCCHSWTLRVGVFFWCFNYLQLISGDWGRSHGLTTNFWRVELTVFGVRPPANSKISAPGEVSPEEVGILHICVHQEDVTRCFLWLFCFLYAFSFQTTWGFECHPTFLCRFGPYLIWSTCCFCSILLYLFFLFLIGRICLSHTPNPCLHFKPTLSCLIWSYFSVPGSLLILYILCYLYCLIYVSYIICVLSALCCLSITCLSKLRSSSSKMLPKACKWTVSAPKMCKFRSKWQILALKCCKYEVNSAGREISDPLCNIRFDIDMPLSSPVVTCGSVVVAILWYDMQLDNYINH